MDITQTLFVQFVAVCSVAVCGLRFAVCGRSVPRPTIARATSARRL